MPRKRPHRISEAKPKYAANEIVVSASEFKARCLDLIDRIQQTHGEVIVTRYRKPVARLVPVTTEEQSAWGWLRGGVVEMGDIVTPTGVPWDAAK